MSFKSSGFILVFVRIFLNSCSNSLGFTAVSETMIRMEQTTSWEMNKFKSLGDFRTKLMTKLRPAEMIKNRPMTILNDRHAG